MPNRTEIFHPAEHEAIFLPRQVYWPEYVVDDIRARIGSLRECDLEDTSVLRHTGSTMSELDNDFLMKDLVLPRLRLQALLDGQFPPRILYRIITEQPPEGPTDEELDALHDLVEHADYRSHVGTTAIVLLRGELDVRVARGAHQFRLGVGDAVIFNASEDHSAVPIGPEPRDSLSVTFWDKSLSEY